MLKNIIDENLSPSINKPKLLDHLRAIIPTKHYSLRTEESYIQWIKRFIIFHNRGHPNEMSEVEINQFLSHLAVKKNVAAATQNQALCAIVFLYKHVLNKKNVNSSATKAQRRDINYKTLSRKEESIAEKL